jgi:hypothetical protein
VVSLQSLFDGPDLNSAGLLGEPPAPSRLLSAQPSAKTPIDPEPHDLFVHTMQQFLKETAPLDPDTSSGCWLAALVHMQATSRADAVDHVLDWHQLPDPSPDEMAAMKRHHAEQLTLLAASLTDSIDQVSFFRRYRPDVRSADYEKAVAMMERLLQQVSRELKHIEYGLEVRFRVQSMEASNLTIKEGHSAVACESKTRFKPYRMLTDQCNSDRACVRLHSHQPGFVSLRHERTRDQRHRTQDLGFCSDVYRVSHSIRSCMGMEACIERAVHGLLGDTGIFV